MNTNISSLSGNASFLIILFCVKPNCVDPVLLNLHKPTCIIIIHSRLKPASLPVHMPVRRGQLPRQQQKRKDMQDTVKEFSFGALGIRMVYSRKHL
jgi:hypothetical protein